MMDTKQFLSSVLSEEGYYCTVGIKDGQTVQKFYSSIDSLVETAENFDLDGYDAYYALGTFDDQNSRKADNVKQLKALFLDLDCGEGKPYPTQSDAIAALKDFCKHYALPKPTSVVNSGRGVHVYWVLSKAYIREEWLPVAERLKAACVEQGLDADPVVTADAARILRIPNTHNFKATPALDVEVLSMGTGLVDLDAFAAKLPHQPIPVVSVREYSEQDKKDMEQAMGLSPYVKRFAKLLAATGNGGGCGQLRKAILEPNDMTYPEWLHILSIAKFCEDGEQAIHLVSKGYEGYSHEETEKIASSVDAPHLCTTFSYDNPSACEACPHNGKIKSPIRLCMEIPEATAKDNVVEVAVETPVVPMPEGEDEEELPVKLERHTIPDYPFPYFRSPNGGVFMRTKDKEGNADEVLIYKRDLYLTKRLRDPIDGPAFEFKYHSVREGIQTFVISGVRLSSKEEFRKAMGMNGIQILNTKSDALMVYVQKWIEQLQETQDEITVKTQFGWTEGNKSFVIGDKEVFADRIEPNPPGARTAQYFSMFAKKGTLEGWKRVTSFYNKKGFQPHQFMFALSFGSPLMEFVPNVSGAIFHLMSAESGLGKTTGQWGGASVWGNHKKLVLKGKDTVNSVWNRAELHKNLVLYIDELSNYKAKEASDFAYAVSDGEQKNRQTNTGQNQERYRGEEWSLLCGTSGNTSLIDKMGEYRALPKGEAQRVMESTVTQLLHTQEEVIQARALNDDLSGNYGHAGQIFIQYVLNNLDSVKLLLSENIRKLTIDSEAGAENRHWTAQAGAALTGAQIASVIGLIDWDLEALREWIVTKIRESRADTTEMKVDIRDLVTRYVNENIRGVLRIKSTDKPTGETEHLVLPDATPMYNWSIRHEYDINKLYLAVQPFKQWVVLQQLSYKDARDMIYKELNGESKRDRLGRGTKMSMMQQQVLVMSWDDLDVTDSDSSSD